MDRIKIQRGARGAEVHLSMQHVLNCGGDVAGSCYGGSGDGAYQWIHDAGYFFFFGIASKFWTFSDASNLKPSVRITALKNIFDCKTIFNRGVAYDTSNPYMACSSESDQGICKGQDWSCTPENVARTCSSEPSCPGPH